MPSLSAAADAFTPRLEIPRLAPVGTDLTEAQRAMLASRANYNIYKTLAHHPDLYARWSPLGQFLLNGSSLPPREREIVMLRMGWLCQSEYEWSQHARIAKNSAGMTAQEVQRIAAGANAPGWSAFERTLLRMVDELRYDTMISDATWQALRTKYSDRQIMESLFTAAQYQLVSMALNSLGVQLDPELTDRLPTDVPPPALAQRPSSPRLSQPRIKALEESAMSVEQRELVRPQLRDGAIPNLYATIANHPKLYEPRLRFGSYLQRDSLLPPKTRELLILRTAWLINSAYEWAHHAPSAKSAGFTDAEIASIAADSDAATWSEEHRALLRAADDLRREAFITAATWQTLTKFYDTKQLVEIIYTVGGYTMTGLAINSFGIQVEPGYPTMPSE